MIDTVIISSVIVTPQVIAFSLFVRRLIYGPSLQAIYPVDRPGRICDPGEKRWDFEATCDDEMCTEDHDRILVLT